MLNVKVNKENLDAVVTGILKDMTIEQLAFYAENKFASHGIVTPSGIALPKSAVGGRDGASGVDTDFPVSIAMGQTWNSELLGQIGNVIGTELRGKYDFDDPNPFVFTATSDMRGNPLCGRYYEGFSEDELLTNVLADSMCAQISGEDDFYLLAQPATKHYFGYQAEWDRTTKNNYFNKRTLMDEQCKGFYDALRSGHAIGIMNSFGGTNGIPNALSLYNDLVALPMPYHLYSMSDFNNDYFLSSGLGNGFDDVYVSNPKYIAALMIKAKTYSNNLMADMVSVQDFIDAVQDGVLNVTREDLEELIRPQIELWIRTGLFGKEEYPYIKMCKDYSPIDSGDEEHKRIALQAGQEGIVLLKNEGNLLPLSPEKRIFMTGVLGNTLIKPWSVLNVVHDFKNAHLTPYEALQAFKGESTKIVYDDNFFLKNVYLKSDINQRYLVVSSEGKLFATEKTQDTATLFQIIDWGQDVFSFRKAGTNEYMQSDGTDVYFETIPKTGKIPIFTYEQWGEGRAMRYGALISDSFQQLVTNVPFYEYYISMGNYLLVDTLSGSITLDGEFRKVPLDNEIFTAVEVVMEDNLNTQNFDCAIVVVGIPSYIDGSEMTDRPSMSIGEQQNGLVKNIASRFSGKTIVVLSSDYPLDIEEIEKNKNVAAIIFYPYSGQYGGLALAQTIYGEINPSGKLSFTWPNNKAHLPKLASEEGIDPRYTVNMKEVDPASNKLTYMYEEDNVLYPFGFGLTYSKFLHSDYKAEIKDGIINISVKVANQSIAGKEIIQVYAVIDSKFYGRYMPIKKLIGFIKSDIISENESQILFVNIPVNRLAQWFASINGYAVEKGKAEIFIVGTDYQSENVVFDIEGAEIPPNQIYYKKNVWEVASFTEGMRGAEVSKKETMYEHTFHCACESSKEQGYIVIPKVEIVPGIINLRIAAVNSGKIELFLQGLEGEKIGSVNIQDTGYDDYEFISRINNSVITGRESRYVNVTIDVNVAAGIYDLYLLVHGKGIKIDAISLSKKSITSEWITYQGNNDNNGVIEANYNHLTSHVTDEILPLSNGMVTLGEAAVGGETLVYEMDSSLYAFTQYNSGEDGVHIRAFVLTNNTGTLLWDRQIYKDRSSAKQYSTPIIVTGSKYGPTIYAASTQYDRVFGTFVYEMMIKAKESNKLIIERVRLVGQYHTLKITTGLNNTTGDDISAEIKLQSKENTYQFTTKLVDGEFILNSDDNMEGDSVFKEGYYTLEIEVHNKSNNDLSAQIQILIPHWELCQIRNLTSPPSVVRMLGSYGEASTAIKQFGQAIYFGTYDGYGCYFKYSLQGMQLLRCNPEKGDAFFLSSMTEIRVADRKLLVCGSEYGRLYLMDEKESFSSSGESAIKSINLHDYIETVGKVRSGICRNEDFIYFTTDGGYLWSAEIESLLDETPMLNSIRLAGNSISTPTVVDNMIFIGSFVHSTGGDKSGFIEVIKNSNGILEKLISFETGPVYSSPIVNKEDDAYYIFFTTGGVKGQGICFKFANDVLSRVWSTEAPNSIQGMSAGKGILIYGDGDGNLHLIR